MPLVFGIPSFDRSGPHPPSPWADLCSLLNDCVYNNVVLLIDDRMRLLEEAAAYLSASAHTLPADVITRTTELLMAVNSSPHSRVLLAACPADGNSAADLAELVTIIVANVSFSVDFEYAFPTRNPAEALERAGEALCSFELAEADTSPRLPYCGATSTEVVNPLSGDQSHVVGDHGDPRNELTGSFAAAVTPCQMQGVAKRADELVWVGGYQWSSASVTSLSLREKTSFGSEHKLLVLEKTIGRALRFAETVDLLDSMVGFLLGEVQLGASYKQQPRNVQRVIDSCVFYARLWQHACPKHSTSLLRMVTYGRRLEGPSEKQQRHFEKLVMLRAGRPFKCDVRIKQGNSKSAHDRYLVTPQCVVDLPGGIDAAETRETPTAAGGKRLEKRTRAEKHFTFLCGKHNNGVKLTDVQQDLKRYEAAPPYFHPNDVGNAN